MPLFSQLSVASDGPAWGIEKMTGNLYKTQIATAQSWQAINMPTPQMVCTQAATETIYVLSGNSVLYGCLPDKLNGTVTWNAAPANPSQLSLVAITIGISTENIPVVWAIASNRALYFWNTATTIWTSWGVSADMVDACCDGSLLRLDKGNLFQQAVDSNVWIPVATPETFASIACGTTGWIWGVGVSGNIYHFDGTGNWVNYPGLKAVGATLSAGDDSTLWGIINGAACSLDSSKMAWNTELSGHNITGIAIADAGHRFVISDGVVIRDLRDANVWYSVTSGSFTNVAPVSEQLFFATTGGNAVKYQFVSGQWQSTIYPSPTFTPIGVAAAPPPPAGGDPTFVVWDVNGTIYQYISSQWTVIHTMPAGIVTVDVAPGGYYVGLSTAGTIILFRPYFLPAFPNGWVKMPSVPATMADISVVTGGGLYAVDNTNTAWIYAHGWRSLGNIGITSIDASSGDNVWGLRLDSTPFKLGAMGVGEGPVGIKRKGMPEWCADNVNDETYSTHLWIVQHAAALAAGAPGSFGTQIAQLINPSSPTDFSKNLRQGLYDADVKDEYMGAKILGQSSWEAHFYDADSGVNWLGHTSPTALTSGVMRFYQAIGAYLANNMAQAGYQLGLALHYLTDLTQPMHAANYTHISSLLWGYHGSFERHVMELQSTVTPPSAYTVSSLGLDPAGYLKQAATNSKSKYYTLICPKDLSYLGFFPPRMEDIVADNVGAILTDAINITSQFMVAWMQAAAIPINISYTQWTGLPPSIQGSPAITAYYGNLYCFFQDGSTNGLRYITAKDGLSWLPEQATTPDSQTVGAPGLAVFQERLFVAYRGTDGGLWIKSLDDIGWVQDKCWFNDYQLIASPTLKAFKGSLFCYFVENDGMNSPLYLQMTDGINWGPPTGMGNVYSCDKVAITEFGGKLFCLHQDGGGNGDLLFNTSLDGQTWTSDQLIRAGCMSGGPAVFVFAGTLYVCFEDKDATGEVMMMSTSDGINWSITADIPVFGGTNGAPAIGVFDTQIVCITQSKNTPGTLTLTIGQSSS